MNPKIGTFIETISRETRPFASVLITLAVYWCMKAIFFLVTSDAGLLVPSGSLNLGVAIFGGLLVLLRLWVLFVVPALVVYRVACRISGLLSLRS